MLKKIYIYSSVNDEKSSKTDHIHGHKRMKKKLNNVSAIT